MNVIYKIKPATELRSSQKKSSYYLNEMLGASVRLAPTGPRFSASKIAPGDFVRKNLAGDRPALFIRDVSKQRIPAPHPFEAKAKNRSRRFFARFPLNFVPFIQYAV